MQYNYKYQETKYSSFIVTFIRDDVEIFSQEFFSRFYMDKAIFSWLGLDKRLKND